MPRPKLHTIRRGATAAWLALLTAAWLTTFGVGAGAEDGHDLADEQSDVLGPLVVVPRTNYSSGPEGTTTQVASATVPVDYVGSACTLRVTGSNQWSVHPGNDLLVSSGGVTIVVADFEAQPDANLSATGNFGALGEMVTVSVRFGADGISSGGVTVGLEQCTVPGPPIPEPTTTTEPPASTTEPETSETSTTEPPTTEPSTSEPSSTEPSTTEPSTSETSTTEPSTTETSTTEPSTTEPTTTTSSTEAVPPAGPTTAPTEPPTTVTETSVVASTPDEDQSTIPPASVQAAVPSTSDVEVLGIQQLPHTGPSETIALSGLTLVTLGWLFVSWSRRFEPELAVVDPMA